MHKVLCFISCEYFSIFFIYLNAYKMYLYYVKKHNKENLKATPLMSYLLSKNFINFLGKYEIK
jgi:hypothetical protein